MGERQDDGPGFLPWLARWVEEMAKSRPESVAAGELMWAELRDTLGPHELGVYFTLLSLADGRDRFTMHPQDVLGLLAMSAVRFDQTTQRLVQCGLVETWPAGCESVEWRILRKPVE
jgi:hypothetical protein